MDSLSVIETVNIIEERISKGIFTQHVVVNVAKLVHMQNDTLLATSVKACDIINIDGSSIVKCSNLTI